LLLLLLMMMMMMLLASTRPNECRSLQVRRTHAKSSVIRSPDVHRRRVQSVADTGFTRPLAHTPSEKCDKTPPRPALYMTSIFYVYASPDVSRRSVDAMRRRKPVVVSDGSVCGRPPAVYLPTFCCTNKTSIP